MRISKIYRFLWVLWLVGWLDCFAHHHHFAIFLIAVTPILAVLNQFTIAHLEKGHYER